MKECLERRLLNNVKAAELLLHFLAAITAECAVNKETHNSINAQRDDKWNLENLEKKKASAAE